MNPPEPAEPRAHLVSTAGNEINLIDWLAALVRRKKLLLGLPALFAACALFVSILAPNIYKATAKILPSQQSQSNAVAMLNHLGGFAGTAAGALNIRIPIELYLSILKSRTVADNLIQRFQLNVAYGKNLLEATREALEKNTTITVSKDGLIAIAVEDKDPKRAAQLANAYVDELLKLVKTMALTEASHRRLFFERRLQAAKDNLAETQIAPKLAENRRGAVDVHAYAMTEATARLRAQISAKEIELGAMQAFVTINNQEYNRGQQELGGMRAELARLEGGNTTMQRGAGTKELQVDTDNSDNRKALHDARYYEMLYALLLKQYEAARIDEAKDSSTIQVLDEAVEPERSLRPNRTVIVLNFALFGLLMAITWVLLVDIIQIRQRLGRAMQSAKLINQGK